MNESKESLNNNIIKWDVFNRNIEISKKKRIFKNSIKIKF